MVPISAGGGSGPAPRPLESRASWSRAASLTRLPSYQKWKQKQKIDDRDSEDEGTSHQRGPERRGGKRGRGQGRMVLKTGCQVVHLISITWFSLAGLSPSARARLQWDLSGLCPPEPVLYSHRAAQPPCMPGPWSAPQGRRATGWQGSGRPPCPAGGMAPTLPPPLSAGSPLLCGDRFCAGHYPHDQAARRRNVCLIGTGNELAHESGNWA